MALTYELRDKTSFARTFVDRELPHLQGLSRAINKRLVCYADIESAKHANFYLYTLIGTAIDYRIRAFFAPAPHLGGTVHGGLVMIKGADFAGGEGLEFPNKLTLFKKKGQRLVEDFNSASEKLLSELGPTNRRLAPAEEDRLCRFCLLLARLDHARRNWDTSYFAEDMRIGDFDIDVHISAADPTLVADLVALAGQAFEQRRSDIFANFSVVHHGCALAGSADVGGADLDLVVDGRLIEIKTTIKPKITTDNLRQIVGYLLLDYEDEFEIRSACIYLVRQGHLEPFQVQGDLIPSDKSLSVLRVAFREGFRKSKDKRPRVED